MTPPRLFPIKHDAMLTAIPWEAIQPHAAQALVNHRESLETLAERGGLTPCEALAVIEGRPWERMGFTEARMRLTDYVNGTKPVHAEIEEALRLLVAMRDAKAVTRWHLNKVITILERVK